MAATNLPRTARSVRASVSDDVAVAPRPGQGLWFKLLLAMISTALLLAAAAAWLATQSIDEGLATSTLQFEQANHERLRSALTDAATRAQTLALTLASLQTEPRLPEAALRTLVPTLVERAPQGSLIAAVGLWPEPAGATASRGSSLWIRDGRGQLVLREDYNDPRTIPYFREAWYTPARYTESGHCYWSPVYPEILSKRPVVTCAMRLNGTRGFEGVATVSLDLEALGAFFAKATADERGYALLLDRDGRALALSARAQQAFGAQLAIGRNIAELPQKQPGSGALALALHHRTETFLAAALRAPRYDERSVSTLRDNTRELSRADAESALASIWNPQTAPAETLTLNEDPVLGEASYAVLSELPDLQWRLASITPARDGAALVRSIALHTLLLAGAAALLWLLLVSLVMQSVVVQPLRRIAQALSRAEQADDPLDVTLDASSRDEIGSVAHWLNERTRQLRERDDRGRVDRSQLATEVSERQRAQEALARVEQRAALTLANIEDAVVYTDGAGLIEALNPAAEQLLNAEAASLRGHLLAEAIPLRLGGEHGTMMAGLVETVVGRGTRLDYPGGVFLGDGVDARELHLVAVPLVARSGRRIGCAVLFRPLTAESILDPSSRRPASAVVASVPDLVTGLGDRIACERWLKSHADSTLLVIGIAGVAEINDAVGHHAGDEALRSVADQLAAQIGNSECLFKLPGEQFAVVVDRLAPAATESLATELRSAVSGLPPLTADDQQFDLEAGVGIEIPDAADPVHSPAERLRRACIAARTARQSGSGVELWQPQHDPAAGTVDDGIWIERIRAGLDRNLFHLTTQAIIPTRMLLPEGEVFEMLLTLEDEEGFWAPPSAFLPVAERHGLDAELDRWVIRHTVETATTQPGLWDRLAFIGINLSAAAFSDGVMLDYLAEQLGELPPGRVGKLCFELREDQVNARFKQALRFCEAMRALGCRVAIDQFQGRRAVDVAILRRLPASLVKLDTRSFRAIATDEIEQMQAQTQLAIVHHLGKRAIVTGIDDERTAAAWRKLGADYLQGYALSKPSPIMFST